MTVKELALAAKGASYKLASLDQQAKNDALHAMAQGLLKHSAAIVEANALDIQAGKEKGMTKSLLDRLMLNTKRIEDMADGLRQVAALPDPVGEVVAMWTRPNGLEIGQRRVPLGVIGMIYEARPNVTCDAAGLCIKSGNAVVLRGGSKAIHSDTAIVKALKSGLQGTDFPADALQLIENTDRASAVELMGLVGIVDVLIPRGGAGLIRSVVDNAKVPVIETGTGNCHVYVDAYADFDMALSIVYNAKTSRVSVCNSAESLVVHSAVAEAFLPLCAQKLGEKNVELRGCPRTKAILPDIKDATEDDYYTEYNDYIMSVKIVDSLEEAIVHINKYNTRHSEAIITKDYASAQKFLKEINAAAVYVNASTRFTDGCEFGFGAEIGISNQKLHAMGPIGLKQLTTIKYIIYGNGQIR